MNAINHSVKTGRRHSPIIQPDTRAELRRHSVDLRIHALVMLGNALFTGYCGYCTSGASGTSASQDVAPVQAPPDILSLCVCAAFTFISLACLFEAHRFWRKAAVIRSQVSVGKPPAPPVFDRLLRMVRKPLRTSLTGAPSPLQAL